MRKLAKLVVSGTIAFAAFGGVAAAQASTCTITGTGPGSVNTCTFDAQQNLTVNCTNGATITLLNGQLAQSGTGIVSGNTSGGGATSGNASNSNQAAVDYLVNGCLAAAPAPTVPTPPAGGMGGGEVAAAPAPAAPVAVKALPQTGESNLAVQAGIGALVFASIAGIAHAAVAAYRRSSLGQL